MQSRAQPIRIFDPDNPATLRPWLIDHVCRFWLARIHDPAGGFFENLDALGAPVAGQRRTTLVQARLTYVFSHAYLLSGDPTFREAARHGLAFLMRAARAPDGGWFRAVSVDGATLDNTRDAYDHAFVLFALAWYCRATGDRARSSSPTRPGSSCSTGWPIRSTAASSRSSRRAARA